MSKMYRDRRNIAIIIFSFALVVSGIGNVYLMFGPEIFIGLPISIIFRAGTQDGPYDLDPINSFAKASNDVIEQVCEGLYAHNLSDSNLEIVPRLALDYGVWDSSGTHFTIPLRRNVSFHDGTPFNAEAVKWNFERINWFVNGTGTLNTTLSKAHSLWKFPNGTVILDPTNPITIYNEFTVIINLRSPYTILESLLCFITASMLSPQSTPKHEYINTPYGRIIGTGPFVFDYYTVDREVKFHRWNYYWRELAFFEIVIFDVMNDYLTRYNAIKSHTVDCLIDTPPFFMSADYSDPTLTVRSGLPSLTYGYLGMNNKKINKTWRQAISYGLNYTYITEELQDGTVYRANGPLAPNFPGYDPNIQSATYNLTKAREIVVSMGLGYMNWTDAQWKAADFQTWNYSYNIGNDFREDLSILLQHNLDLIGIEVIDQPLAYFDFLYRIYGDMGPEGYDFLELYWAYWGPDLLSPYNTIFQLYSNQSNSNSAQYHNLTVETWLDEVLKETNRSEKPKLYLKILRQIVEVDMPHAFGYHRYQWRVHSADLHDIPYNALGKFYVYPIYRG